MHVLTGPIYVCGADAGDVLQVSFALFGHSQMFFERAFSIVTSQLIPHFHLPDILAAQLLATFPPPPSLLLVRDWHVGFVTSHATQESLQGCCTSSQTLLTGVPNDTLSYGVYLQVSAAPSPACTSPNEN